MRVLLLLLLLFFFIIFCFVLVCNSEKEGNKDQPIRMTTTLGSIHDSNSNDDDIHNLAQYAVTEHNTKNKAAVELVRVVKSEEQVVAGTLHHLTIEVIESGEKKLYNAKIWVKPWLNFKELQQFTLLHNSSSSFTSSDLGSKKGDHVSGEWKSVPLHDPLVQDAANHAINTIQLRSNSLFPYQLNEILHANAQVVDSSAKFDMLLKVKRGDKDEKFKVEVHRNSEGAFSLIQMEADHS